MKESPQHGATFARNGTRADRMVFDIAGNLLDNQNLTSLNAAATTEGSPSTSILDTILSKLQAIEQSEREMQHYLVHSASSAGNIKQTTGRVDWEGRQREESPPSFQTNITKLPMSIEHKEALNRFEPQSSSLYNKEVVVKQLNESESQAFGNSLVLHYDPSARPVTDAAANSFVTRGGNDSNLIATPNVLNTHENAISNYVDRNSCQAAEEDVALYHPDSGQTASLRLPSEVANTGLLSLLGVSTKTTRERAHRREAAGRLRDKELAYLRQFPSLKEADLDCGFNHDAIFQYRKELARARQFKDVAFLSRGVSMSEVADRLSTDITDRIVKEVCEEVDQYLSELTDSLVNKI